MGTSINFFKVSVKLSRSFFRFLLSACVAVLRFIKSFLLVSNSTRSSASSSNRFNINSCPSSPTNSGWAARNSSSLTNSKSVYKVLQGQKRLGLARRTHNSGNLEFQTADVVVRISDFEGQGTDYRLELLLPRWLVLQLYFEDTFLC